MRCLTLGVQSRESDQHPADMPPGIAAVTAHMKSQSVAPFHDHSQKLMATIALDLQLARHRIEQLRLHRAYQGTGAHRAAWRGLGAEHLLYQLLDHPAPITAASRQLVAIDLGQGSRVGRYGFDSSPVAYRRAAMTYALHQFIDPAQ